MDIEKLTLSCEYQPLLTPHSLEIFGHEALARFRTATGELVPPNLVFGHLHANPTLFSKIEAQAKAFQIQHAPPGRLFVNIDPHAMQGEFAAAIFDMLNKHHNITVEIIENTCITEAESAKALVDKFTQLHIDCALDDIGAPHAMLCLELITKVQCLKFDRHWLSRIDDNAQYQLLSCLIEYGKKTNKLCILEGVETKAQLITARKLKVDLVQGFLFKAAFKTAKQSEPCVS
jgi:EAL domain-containing protein (putative c-di-GMP-specific phosphodiesterase class I)